MECPVISENTALREENEKLKQEQCPGADRYCASEFKKMERDLAAVTNERDELCAKLHAMQNGACKECELS